MSKTIDMDAMSSKNQQTKNTMRQKAHDLIVPSKDAITQSARETLGLIRRSGERTPVITARRARDVRNANGFNLVVWGRPKVGKTHLAMSAGQFEGIKNPDGSWLLVPGYPVCLIDAHYGAAPVTKNKIFSKLVDEEDPSGMTFITNDYQFNPETGQLELVEIEGKLGKLMISQPDASGTNYEKNPMILIEWLYDQVEYYSNILNKLGRGTIVIDSWTNLQKAWNAVISLAIGKDEIGATRNPDVKDKEAKIPQYWWTARNERMESLVKSILSAKGHSIFIVNEGAPFLVTDEQQAKYVPEDPDTPNAEPKCFDDLKFLTDLTVHARADPMTHERFMKVTMSRYNMQEIRQQTIYNADFDQAVNDWYFDLEEGRNMEAQIGSDALDKLHKEKLKNKRKAVNKPTVVESSKVDEDDSFAI